MREELESMLNSDTDNSGHGRESSSSRRRDRGNNNGSNSLMQYVKYHDSYSDLLSEVGNSFQNVRNSGRNYVNGNSRTQSFLCVLFPLLVFAIIVLYVYFAWSGSSNGATVTTSNTLNVPVEATTMITNPAATSVYSASIVNPAWKLLSYTGIIDSLQETINQLLSSITPHLRNRH